MKNCTIGTFDTFGYLLDEFTEEQLKPIKQEVEEIQSDFSKAQSHNYDLAGHINNQFTLNKCKRDLFDLLIPYVQKYEEVFRLSSIYAPLTRSAPIALDVAWVNFQKKHEYNPLHIHPAFMSFALWLKIPYTLEDERKFFPEVGNGRFTNGQFQFHYPNTIGDVASHNIPLDKKFENKFVIFPSSMAHSVFPFYSSDEYRISISGNFRFLV